MLFNKTIFKISIRDLYSGSKSSSNVGVTSSNQTKQEVVFGKTNLSQKPSVPKSPNNDANDTPQNLQVYIFIHISNENIDEEIFGYDNLYFIFFI